MPSVDQYLSAHPNLKVSDSQSDEGGGTTRIQIHLTGVSDDRIFFSHMGRAFSVARADVLDISDAATGDPANKGSELLELKSSARVQSQNFLMASAMEEGTPFTMARPVGPGVQPKRTAAQIALREKMRNLLSDDGDDDWEDSYTETWETCGEPPIGDLCTDDIVD